MSTPTLPDGSPIPVDRNDGYSPLAMPPPPDPSIDPAVLAAAASQADAEAVRLDGSIDVDQAKLTLDGFKNFLTGLGDPARDKSLATSFSVKFLTGWECQDRWRGSDLGGRIVEKVPNEMTRRGWNITIQPDEDDEPEEKKTTVGDALRGQVRRAMARKDVAAARRLTQVLDALPAPMLAAPAPAAHVPGDVSDVDDGSEEIVEELDRIQRRLKVRESMKRALEYSRAYGGAGVLLGVDDGKSLLDPLDLDAVRSLKHLTVFRGGWDGEIIAWSYYADPQHPKYGEPRVYMIRNIGVPITTPPAPGETQYTMPPVGPIASTIFFVHESRLLLFSEAPVSRLAQVQMRGWGDSVFMRVEEVLAQFGQTWSGIAILMQEYSMPVMSMEGLSQMLSSKNPSEQAKMQARVLAMSMSMSVARMRLIDTKEKLERLSVPMSGVAEVLAQFSLRLAAAVDMPVAQLMGQVKGGLGDSGDGDRKFFYDGIDAKRVDRLTPPLTYCLRVIFRSKDGPTGGKEPKRWTLTYPPLEQMTDKERAEYRKTIAATDEIYIKNGVVTPEEVCVTRFAGSDYNDGPIVIDVVGRARAAEAPPAPALPATSPTPAPTPQPTPTPPPGP